MLTAAEALMVSCNDAMMQIAAKMGATTFTRYMTAFGFGQKTGIDLPGEADAKGLVRSASEMNSWRTWRPTPSDRTITVP